MNYFLEKLKRPFRAKYLGLRNNSNISSSAKVFRGTKIGDNVRIGPFCDISVETEIGRWTNLRKNVITRNKVKIGKFCAVADSVRMLASNHDMSKAALQCRWQQELLDNNYGINQKSSIKIGNNVWIGANAIILPDVEISNHAIIGAGSVVTRNVDEFEVVAGNPITNIRYRFTEEERENIRDYNWTEMNDVQLKQHKEFFKKKRQ